MKTLSEEICKVASGIFCAIGTPVALACFLKLKYGCYRDLAEKRVSPCDYLTAEQYAADQAAVSLLRKMVMNTGIDTKAVADAQWESTEKACFVTNQQIAALHLEILQMEYPLANDPSPTAEARLRYQLVKLIREKMGILLGRAPENFRCKMGKHATYAHKGERCLLPDKFYAHPDCTTTALLEATAFEQTSWARGLQGMLFCAGPLRPTAVSLVRGNRWSTVPKDGTTDRSIGVEPTLNLFHQLGIGSVMKRRLQRWGLLRPDAKETHMRFARIASKTRELSTLDLSSASDTIALQLCNLVVPADWLQAMKLSRSPLTAKPLNKGTHKWQRLEKFSSMGNGYTFELETALFTAISWAVCELFKVPVLLGKDLTVFGDDIICPTSVAPHIATALRFFGFTLNQKKTFIGDSPFRESCGGDYFDGVDVRPVHIDTDPDTPGQWISLHNKVLRLSTRFHVASVNNYIRGLVPRDIRKCNGPVELGDLFFHTRRSKWQLRLQAGRQEIRAVIPEVSLVPLERWDHTSATVAFLYGCSSKGAAPRGEPLGYRIGWIPCFM